MSRPRALVVRSGANPFLPFGEECRIEIVEKVSHAIEAIAVSPDSFEAAADLAIFTSQVAVERLLGDPPLASAFRRAVAGGRVVAVGAATEKALREKQIPPAIIASGSGESILERLGRNLDGRHVLIPCGEDASPEIAEGLRARGARVTRVVVYRKIPRPSDPALDREIRERTFAAFCVTSPSAARWLLSGLGPASIERLRRTPAVVLGPFTRRYLESRGVERVAVTEQARFAAAARLLESLATAPAGQ